MKILMIGQLPPPYGGQIINIEKIKNILDANNFDLRFVRMEFSQNLNDTGNFSLKKVWELFLIIIKILKNLLFFKPDYIYYPPSGCEKIPVYRDLCILFLIRLFRFKTIFHFHAGGISEIYSKLHFLIKPIFRFCFFYSEYSICMSLSGLRDPVFLKSKNNSIIPYGVNIETPLDIQYNKIDKNTFDVLFVGVCRESKGILDFLKIIEIANRQNPRIIGKIVGEIFSEKEKAAIFKSIEKGIVFYEGVKIGKEKENIFINSDLFLFPTFFEHENFPTVILESFAFGLPVISTKWRGVVDQINDNYNGFLCDLNDVDKMSDLIIHLSKSPSEVNRLSLNAREDYKKYYTDSIFKNNILNFFNSLK